MSQADGTQTLAPKNLIIPEITSLAGPPYISGMMFLSGGSLMIVSGSTLAYVNVV